MQYGMVIDTTRCFGCLTCVTSCKMANNAPQNVFYNRVLTRGGLDDEAFGAELFMDSAAGTYEAPSRVHVPLACQHCAEPACLAACPTGATQKREDGIVWVDNSLCIGCDSCIQACPYQGVRSHLVDTPMNNLGFDCGEADAPTHVGGTVEKCTMCANRVDRGLAPKCVESCLGFARFFGDLDDPESEVAQLVAEREVVQLLPGAGTNPSVYYIA